MVTHDPNCAHKPILIISSVGTTATPQTAEMAIETQLSTAAPKKAPELRKFYVIYLPGYSQYSTGSTMSLKGGRLALTRKLSVAKIYSSKIKALQWKCDK